MLTLMFSMVDACLWLKNIYLYMFWKAEASSTHLWLTVGLTRKDFYPYEKCWQLHFLEQWPKF